jgi:transaldolase
MSQFEQLAQQTIIVADTGDIDQIRKFKPTDATTNPSLIFKAAQQPQYKHLIDEAIEYALKKPGLSRADLLEWTMDRLAVNFGTEIAGIVPGVVSVEVDASIAFDTEKTIQRARRLIQLFAEKGIGKNKILIKIASTWFGIKAAEQLEKEGTHCNLTLLFNTPAQAAACAEAGVTLISPFVGRVTDWHKKNGFTPKTIDEDIGVVLVRGIYEHYKRYGYKTIVMGASFRNKEQILALAGCDKLTISPDLLQLLTESKEEVPRRLKATGSPTKNPNPPCDEKSWYRHMCNDPMALEKLHEGIRGFEADTKKLEVIIQKLLDAKAPRSKL